MLKIGEMLCTRHKGIIHVDKSIYYDGEHNVFFELKRKGLKYILDNIDFGDLPLSTELVLGKVKEKNGVPTEIEVWYKTGELKTKRIFRPANRICPYCLRKHNPEIVHLMNDASYSSFILAEVGIPETGKSTWKSAVTTHQVEKTISDLTGRNYEMEIVKPNMAEMRDVHTPNSIVDLKYDLMCLKQNNKILANIYLIDTAGEFCLEELNSANEFAELLSFLDDYMDGVFAFYDPRFVVNQCMNEYKRKRKKIEGDFREVFSQLNEPKVPVAVVMTGADTILNAIEQPGVMMKGKVPIITKNSPLFKNVRVSSKNEVLQHITLARDFFHNATKLVGRKKENKAYFLVSSGEMEGEKKFNYTAQTNVSLPLVWMLNQLGICEWEEGR